MTKLVHTFVLAVSLLLLWPHCIHAVDIGITPPEVNPGGVFLVRVQSDGKTTAEGIFKGEEVNFHPASNNQLIALVPVDVDTEPGEHRIEIRYGDETREASVNVRSREFRTIKLTLPEEKVTLSEENQRRVAREVKRLVQIWLQETKRFWKGPFSRPTDTEISTEFGVVRIMNEKRTSVHRGMDFRGKKGTPVRAINSGEVILRDNLFYGGNTLILNHGMGLYSVYMHLSEFSADEGEWVPKGQAVGLIGSSGRATGPHLHLSVKLNGVSIDPESLFNLELSTLGESGE